MRASTMMPTLATLLLALMASSRNSPSSCSSSLVQALPSPLLDHLLDDPILLSPVGVEMGSHRLLGSQKSKSLDKHRGFDKNEDEEEAEDKDEKENEKERRQLVPRSSPFVGPLSRSRPRKRSLSNSTPPSPALPPSSASNTASSQPRNVPMPLLRPRETDTQLGEKDEELEDASKNCGEGGMHDCFVNHEKERIRERRAEREVLPSAVPAHGDGDEREEAMPARMMPRRRR